MPTDIVYSVIIPVDNEAENPLALYRSLQDKLHSRGDSCKVVFVDDGSTDGSFEIIKGIAAKEGAIKVIRLRRNYGQTAALQAGISTALAHYYLTDHTVGIYAPEDCLKGTAAPAMSFFHTIVA